MTHKKQDERASLGLPDAEYQSYFNGSYEAERTWIKSELTSLENSSSLLARIKSKLAARCDLAKDVELYLQSAPRDLHVGPALLDDTRELGGPQAHGRYLQAREMECADHALL